MKMGCIMLTNTQTAYRISAPLELDETFIASFLDRLKEMLCKNPKVIEVDCSRLDLVYSRHINTLWQSRLLCEKQNTRMRLVNVSHCLYRILKVLDLYDLFLFENEASLRTSPCPPAPQFGNRAKMLHLQFGPENDKVIHAQNQFNHFLQQFDLSPILSTELLTLFHEAASNISQHSDIGHSSVIRFTATPSDESILLQFIDDGAPFDPTTIPADFDALAAAQKGKIRGYGLILLRRMSDELSYERSEGQFNILTLEKKWS